MIEMKTTLNSSNSRLDTAEYICELEDTATEITQNKHKNKKTKSK